MSGVKVMIAEYKKQKFHLARPVAGLRQQVDLCSCAIQETGNDPFENLYDDEENEIASDSGQHG